MTDFEKMMANLQVEYIASLDQKISDVEHAYKIQAAVPIQDIFHKLKGTGSTYGVPEITQLGEVMEKLCEDQSLQLEAFVPAALTLLKSIQAARKAGQAFELSEDQVFGCLAKMRKAGI